MNTNAIQALEIDGVAIEEAFALKVLSSKRPFQPARRLGPVVAATVLNLDRRD